MTRDIEHLELSVRAYNCLKNAGVKTVRDLLSADLSVLAKQRHVGRKTINEIRDVITDLGFQNGPSVVVVVVTVFAKGLMRDGEFVRTSPERCIVVGPFMNRDAAIRWARDHSEEYGEECLCSVQDTVVAV